jgi:hypothetical protein
MIKLMEGLEIKFGDDGTWLSFKASNGISSVIRLESLSDASGHIIGTAIQKWSEDRRKEHNAATPPAKGAPTLDLLPCGHTKDNWHEGYMSVRRKGDTPQGPKALAHCKACVAEAQGAPGTREAEVEAEPFVGKQTVGDVIRDQPQDEVYDGMCWHKEVDGTGICKNCGAMAATREPGRTPSHGEKACESGTCDICGQQERDKKLLSMLNLDVLFYGPHPCGCGETICRSSAKDGGIVFDYPKGPIYPNTNWVEHVCKPGWLPHDKQQELNKRQAQAAAPVASTSLKHPLRAVYGSDLRAALMLLWSALLQPIRRRWLSWKYRKETTEWEKEWVAEDSVREARAAVGKN